MALRQDISTLLKDLEGMPVSRPSAYFVDLTTALADTILNMDPNNTARLDKALTEQPAEVIRPFNPEICSFKECFDYVAKLADTDFVRGKHGDAIRKQMEKAAPVIITAMKQEYGDRFAALEPVILHRMALNMNRQRAEHTLNADKGTELYYKAEVVIPPLAELKQKVTGHTAKGFTVQKDEGNFCIEAAQMQGGRDYQEDHVMLVRGNTIPARDVPGTLMKLFARANSQIPDQSEGATACVACLSDGKVTVANTGDSRAFMLLEPVKDNGSYDPSREVGFFRLSAEHRPDDAGEICRLEAMGAKSLKGHERLPDYSRVLEPREDNDPDTLTGKRPGLGAARAFGDKKYAGRVSWIPQVTQTDISTFEQSGYKVHICLATDGMHYGGSAVHEQGGDEKYTRGLYEADYAKLLEAFCKQGNPPVYDNLAKLFTDYAHERNGSDNMSMQVITYDGKSKRCITGGVFDGHGGARVAEKAAEIIGSGLGEFVPLRPVTVPPSAVQKIVGQGATPVALASATSTSTLITPAHVEVVRGSAGYHVQIDVSHLQEPQREQVRALLGKELEDLGLTFKMGASGTHIESSPPRRDGGKANSDRVGVVHCCKLLPSGPGGGKSV